MTVVGVIAAESSRELRRAVLRPQLAPGEPLPGDDEPDAVHLGVTVDGVVVATCFVFPQSCPWRPDVAASWRLRQMATAPDVRGAGYGALVLTAAVDEVTVRGGDLLWLDARESAVGFYARHGFARVGESFTDPDHPIPHLRMERTLVGTAR